MRNRSMAMIVRNGKILMEEIHFYERAFYTIPGGGIEGDETPEEAALRELKEECGLDGKIKKKLAEISIRGDETVEYIFEVTIPDDCEPCLGCDPEEPADRQPIKDVRWVSLDELSEKDRAFLWTYGLLGIDGYFDEILSWGEEISYPSKNK